jgi:hypothetical protein
MKIKGIGSQLSINEKGDCAVRAIASSTNSSYIDAHSYLKTKFKRKSRNGVMGFAGLMKIREGLNFLNNTKYVEVEIGFNKLSVNQFLNNYKTGTYIIIVKDHTFTIKENKIIGNPEDSKKLNKKIQYAFKIIL